MAAAIVLVVLLATAVFWPAGAARHSLNNEDLAHLKRLRDKARGLMQTQMELSWKRRTTGERVDFAATYEGHEKLFSLDTLIFLSKALAKVHDDPNFQKAIEFFRDHVLREAVDMRVMKIDGELDAYLATKHFTYDGKEFPFWQARAMLIDAAEPVARQAISDAVVPILREANQQFKKKQERLHRLARELGYDDVVSLSEQLRGVDLDQFARECQRLLDRTERHFLGEQGWAASFALGMPIDRLRRADLPRLAAVSVTEDRFAADQQMPRLKNALVEMGLTLNHIKIDDAERPNKSPQTACFPVVVPTDVRLSYKPVEGVAAYRRLWHEMGHAQHFSNTKTPVWEFQLLGDSAVADAFSFLFAGLIDHPQFAERHFGLAGEALADHTRLAAYRHLLMVRRYCAKVLYELELHRGAADPASRYRHWMGIAYGLKLDANDGERHGIDVDNYFQGVDYVRAWNLEAMLDYRLTREFGDSWFTTSEAGAYLKRLWISGTFYSADEMANEIGFRRLKNKYLIRRAKRRAHARF